MVARIESRSYRTYDSCQESEGSCSPVDDEDNISKFVHHLISFPYDPCEDICSGKESDYSSQNCRTSGIEHIFCEDLADAVA